MSEEVKQLIAENFKGTEILVENYNQLINDLKRKLINIQVSLKEQIKEELLNIEIDFEGPASSGEDSNCFRCNIKMDNIQFTYEIVIEECYFNSYYYGVTEAQKAKLEENGINGLSHEGDEEPKEIASIVKDEIIKIIEILKEEVLVA